MPTTPCYVLYPFIGNPAGIPSEITYSKKPILATYLDMVISASILDSDDGCFYVALSPDICPTPTSGISNILPDTFCENIPTCFTIGGIGTVTYVTLEHELEIAYAPVQVCSVIQPIVTGVEGVDYAIKTEASCNETACGGFCFKLTNCETLVEIISDNQNLITPYAFGQTVKLDGYNGCWTISKSDTCDCAVNVTVTKTFEDCIACLPIIAYKFTNCSNSKQIKYTLQDFSAVVGKTVSLDCGDCWTVSLINYQPPNTSVIVIENVYDSCVQCTRPYWILTDCSEVLPPVITYTDMTTYVNKFVKLVNDNTCWYVETTTNYVGAGTVTVVSAYFSCDLCSADATCICTKITNTTSQSKIYTYVDCENITQTFTLAAGSSSDKTCVKKWTVRYPATDVIETFGNCYEDTQTQMMTCPAVPTGRVVAPGYSVPTCSIQKYEEIVCRSSEVLYHQALQSRYGISNCCPEDDDKWLLQKELADLASLLDKNYTCNTVSGCCSPASCNCSSCIN